MVLYNFKGIEMIDKEKETEPEETEVPVSSNYDDSTYDEDYFPDYDEDEEEYDDF